MRVERHVPVKIRSNTYIYLALLLLFIPLRWLFALSIAVLFHELGHWVAVRLCGGRLLNVSVGIGGMVMECDVLDDGRQVLSLLCGPLFGFLPVLSGRFLPATALCSWILTVYNLLPILPLDGGRILQILLKNDRAFIIVERIFLLGITAGAIYITTFTGLGIAPILIVIILWIRNRKTPCNTRAFKLQ